MSGFVSGGTIGGDINRFQPASSFTTAPTSGLNTSQNSGQNTSQRMSERSLFLAEILRYHSPVFFFLTTTIFMRFMLILGSLFAVPETDLEKGEGPLGGTVSLYTSMDDGTMLFT